MHLKRKILACMLTAALIINLLPLPAYGEDLIASGTTAGDSIIKNASYSDIAGNVNADNIMKMSVYSIVREYGSNLYRPNQAAAKQDILAALVRATGRQEQAVKLGEQLLARDPSLNSVNSYIMGHIEAAKAAGIITAQEAAAAGTLTAVELAKVKSEADAAKKANWKMTKAQYDQLVKQKTDQLSFNKAYRSAANREEAALWIARALGLQPVAAEEITAVYNYNDWASIKTENLPYIEAVLKKGIMKNSAAAFMPKGYIARGEMASVMNMVVNQSLDKLGYKTGHGKVTSVAMARDIGAVSNTYTTTITIETPTMDAIGINIQKRSTTSSISQESVPVIKNGKIGSETLVSEGDIVEYTLNKDNEAILLHIAQLKEVDGTFVVYDPQRNIVQVGDRNNNMYFLKVMPDSAITVQKEPVDIGRLEPNSPAKAVFANDILKSLSVDVPPELVGGTETPVRIIFADTAGNMIKVADEYDNKKYLELADTAAIYINGDLQDINAIGYDQDAVVRVFNGKVQEVKIYTDIPEEDPNIRLVMTAEVRSISDQGVILATDTDPQKPALYTLDNNTPIIKEKQSVGRSALRQGDRVKIEVNSTNDKHITRMEVQGDGVKVKKIYKGEIKDVVPETGEVILANVYYYGYYDWVKKNGYSRYKLGSDSGIYNGDTSISMDRLKDYIGKTIYAVSKDNYGAEEIVKAVLKDGYEDTIYKSITDVKWTTRQLTMSDGRALNFNDGTIIIKDGRLLESMYLAKGDEAFVIQNRSVQGVGSAPIISLDSLNGFSDYKITRGYLHNMGEDFYTVENSSTMENNTWRDTSEATFLLNDESYVYDNVIAKGFVSPEEFAKSRYMPYTYTWPNYKSSKGDKDYHEDDKYHYDYDDYKKSSKYHEHMLVYVVADSQGNTNAINILEKDDQCYNEDKVYSERLFAGQINTVDKGNKTVTLANAKIYSEVLEKWRPAQDVKPIWVEVPINMEKVVIIKDRKAITMDELEANDNIYVLSNDDYAMFMLVE